MTAEIDVVLRYFQRCRERSTSIVSMYAEDGEFFDCAGPTTIIGRDDIAKYVFGPIFTAFPDFRCDDKVRHIMSHNGVVAAELVITGTHSGEFLGCPASGNRVAWNTTGIWEVNSDGLIAREAYYWDTDTVREQLATRGEPRRRAP